MATSLLGLNAKAYYLSTGSRTSWGSADSNGIHVGAAPANLTEMGNMKDVTASMNKGEADVTTRASDGWRLTQGTLKEAEISFEMQWDPTDSAFAKIFSAWLNNTNIAMAFLDQDKTTSGAQGVWADWSVIQFEKTEPLEEAQKVSVSLKPGRSSVAPEWVKVT